MQMLNLSKIIRKLKKSHSLLIGSLLIFIGFIALTWNYLLEMKEEVYSDMKISMMNISNKDEVKLDVDLQNIINNTNIVIEQPVAPVQQIDYSQYYGVIEIPRIELKRGFYNTDSKYNTIEKNVAMVEGSTMPNVDKGNLMLMAHSGDSYISYFAYLYVLDKGDNVFITYDGVKYQYKIVDIYYVEKNGLVLIKRDVEKTALTLITCTTDSKYRIIVKAREKI